MPWSGLDDGPAAGAQQHVDALAQPFELLLVGALGWVFFACDFPTAVAVLSRIAGIG